VDVDIETLNISSEQVEAAITPHTRGIFAVNLLGAPADLTRLREICDERDLVLIEDNCESMGASLNGVYAGTFGDCGTFSTFFSHHICTIEGGVIVTNDEELQQLCVSLRAHGWTRELPDVNWVHPKTGDPFRDLYRFVLPGYNVRPMEISAAIGLAQLPKLRGFVEQRRANAEIFRRLFAGREDVRIQKPIGESSWFAFSMIFENELRGRRDEIARMLLANGIECRPIVAGDFTKDPVMKHLDYSIHGSLPNAQRIDVDGLYVGNHHFDLRSEIERLGDLIDEVAAHPTLGVSTER
jgi:CDP-6-deoxy-D-xylo-4-hexulose-3-dehydrase